MAADGMVRLHHHVLGSPVRGAVAAALSAAPATAADGFDQAFALLGATGVHAKQGPPSAPDGSVSGGPRCAWPAGWRASAERNAMSAELAWRDEGTDSAQIPVAQNAYVAQSDGPVRAGRCSRSAPGRISKPVSGGLATGGLPADHPRRHAQGTAPYRSSTS
ncbi:hypothetical protein [Lentzea xinjiangensis]|uniref:hypothetical protein n=1 Tax=Lentzea xinjiangensis TaxID=402600 RepID=UPI001160D9A0|nr:hypothetical protein [Lentzea xinjiangensis]